MSTILVAHGSRDPRSSACVREIAAAAGLSVSFLDFNDPDPVSAARDAIAEGHTHITLVPLLLTQAYHVTVDLPEVAAKIRTQHSESFTVNDPLDNSIPGPSSSGVSGGVPITVDIAPPVGHASLAVPLLRGLPDDTDALVVCAAGTSMETGRAHVADIAAEASRLTGLPAKEAFSTGPGGRPGDAVRAFMEQGYQRIAAVQYFIAPGMLCDEAINGAREAGASFIGEPLGVCEELLQLCHNRESVSI